MTLYNSVAVLWRHEPEPEQSSSAVCLLESTNSAGCAGKAESSSGVAIFSPGLSTGVRSHEGTPGGRAFSLEEALFA